MASRAEKGGWDEELRVWSLMLKKRESQVGRPVVFTVKVGSQ